MNEKITFNGRTYNSVEEMPAQVRTAYEAVTAAFADRDQNGMPDLFDGPANTNVRVQSSSEANIIYNGQLYHSLGELPLEARTKYEQAMDKLDANRNNIPDLVEELMGMEAPSDAAPQQASREPSFSSPATLSTATTIEPEGVSWRAVMATALLIGLVCLGAVTLWVLLAK